MKRSPIKRSAKPAKARAKMNPRNEARRATEFARAYGSAARVLWVAGWPCVVCNKTPCQNAHIATGGMGRKADADRVVPLCKPHHHELHQAGLASFERQHGVSLSFTAQLVESRWQEKRSREGGV